MSRKVWIGSRAVQPSSLSASDGSRYQKYCAISRLTASTGIVTPTRESARSASDAPMRERPGARGIGSDGAFTPLTRSRRAKSSRTVRLHAPRR